jgi:hypothetical protein
MRREDIFFAILRSVMWGTPVEVPADTDWRGVLNLAARQKCLHAFSMWFKTNKIATPFDKQLQPAIFAVMGRTARLNHLAADVITLLAEYHIPSTLIKGYSLSALYPDPDMRDFGDVDIYVGEENYLRAAEIVTAAFPDAHWHSATYGGIHYILVIDENLDRVVELHRVTMEFHDKKADALYQAFTKKHLGNSVEENGVGKSSVEWRGIQLPVPGVAYNALYVFMHAWHHFESTGVGFRPLADWALALHEAHELLKAEDWQTLCQDIDRILTALRMKKAWQTFGHVLVNQLQLPAEEFPLYTSRYQRLASRLLRQLLRDGHGARPAKLNIKEIALMRRFPWERPAKHRVMQVGYTACRLVFEAWQMGKLFPDLAWHEFRHSIRLACTKKRG